MEEQLKDLEARMEEQNSRSVQMDVVMQKLLQSVNEISEKLKNSSESPRVGSDAGSNAPRSSGYVPKLEFTRFDGSQPRIWIKKYFVRLLHSVQILWIRPLATMPPRRRRVGLKRMDAAIDALTPMGFPRDLIRRKVKALLNEYGDEGWVFIEEASYKLLIECILEDQEQCEQGESSCNDSQNEIRDQGGEEAGPSEDVPLLEASEPVCSNLDTALTTLTTDASLENPQAELNPSCSPAENVPSPNKTPTANEVSRTNGMLINQEQVASMNDAHTFYGPPGFEDSSSSDRGYVYASSNKHKPCFGWLDWASQDDQSFVLLEPAPVLGWKTRQRQGKRKSRWDVGP